MTIKKSSKQSSRIGLIDGELKSCPRSPNCVSSNSKNKQYYVKPLKYKTSKKIAREKLLTILGTIPRLRIVTQTDTYIHAECKSLLLGFVDDLEFVFSKKENSIHVRSASRTGYSDFGVNRRRVEDIRKNFENNTIE